jgi:predicted DNA-binding transcriptional regulator YafY
VLDKACDRPAHFDLAEHWKAATQRLQEGWQRVEGVLRLDSGAAASMKRWYLVLEELEKGDVWETLRVQFDHPDEAMFVVLGMGSHAEVLEPESLRERVRAEVRAMAERAGTRATSDSN